MRSRYGLNLFEFKLSSLICFVYRRIPLKSSKISKLLIVMLFVTCLCVQMIFAQEADGEEIDLSETTVEENLGIGVAGDAKSETAQANIIRQPFSWTSAGDVLKYEIVIDRFDTTVNDYVPYFFHETNEEETEACMIYIEPVIPVGKYRSEIRVYNILGGFEEELTSHDEFTVRKAYKPEIKGINSVLYMRNIIYLDDLDNNGIFEIEGNNLFLPDNPETQLEYTKYFLRGTRTLFPQKVVSHDDLKNKKITLQFDMKMIDVGVYHIYAQDLSGLHSEESPETQLTVKFKKIVDFDVEAGYNLPVVLHDDTFPTYFNTRFFPFSGQAKITLMPFKRNWGYLGAGLRVSYTRLIRTEREYYINGNLGTGHLMFVYQVPMFKRRIFAELHGGPGITYLNDIAFHFPNNINPKPLNTICLSLNAGASFLIYLNKRLYLEIGADYAMTFNPDMFLGIITPTVGIGWQF